MHAYEFTKLLYFYIRKEGYNEIFHISHFSYKILCYSIVARGEALYF